MPRSIKWVVEGLCSAAAWESASSGTEGSKSTSHPSQFARCWPIPLVSSHLTSPLKYQALQLFFFFFFIQWKDCVSDTYQVCIVMVANLLWQKLHANPQRQGSILPVEGTSDRWLKRNLILGPFLTVAFLLSPPSGVPTSAQPVRGHQNRKEHHRGNG